MRRITHITTASLIAIVAACASSRPAERAGEAPSSAAPSSSEPSSSSSSSRTEEPGDRDGVSDVPNGPPPSVPAYAPNATPEKPADATKTPVVVEHQRIETKVDDDIAHLR